MELYFATGNKGKFEEAKSVIPELRELAIDLPEIQEIDPKKIIEEKLREALKHKNAGIIVEDTSFYFDCLKGSSEHGLPGPLIKWFLKTLGLDGLAKLAAKYGNVGAEVHTIIGYAERAKSIRYFEGVIRGIIVPPRGDKDFGWGPIFLPEGSEKTFGEMEHKEKLSFSMRKIAFQKLKEFLEK